MDKASPFLPILLGVCGALLLSELALQLFYPRCAVRYAYNSAWGLHLLPNQNTHCSHWEYDNSVHTNSLGYNDLPRNVRKNPSISRIVVIGDSFIEGLQVRQEHNFTSQLDENLSTSYPNQPLEVINMGVSGNGVAQYLRLVETRAIELEPVLVIFALTLGNDFRDSHPTLKNHLYSRYYSLRDGKLELLPPSHHASGPLEVKGLAQRIQLLSLIREAIRGTPLERILSQYGLVSYSPQVKAEGSENGSIPIDWAVFQKNLSPQWEEAYSLVLAELSEVKRILEQKHIQFMVMLIPTVASVEERWQEALSRHGISYHRQDWDFARPARTVLEHCAHSQIFCVDLTPEFQRDFKRRGISHSYKHDGHWNPTGHQLAAQIAQEYILANGLMRVTNPKDEEN